MQLSDYSCERATGLDDIKRIAKYIHLTDPYIYPKICEKPDDAAWCAFIGQCAKKRDNIYHIDNLSVVKQQGQIVGIACVVPCGKKLSITEGIIVPEALKKPVAPVVKGYFAPLIEESAMLDGYNIVNVCVDEQHRGRGVGKRLMEHCIGQYGKQPIHLDVIAANTSAIRLYEACGFTIQSEYLGFSGEDILLPCYHMLRQAG